MLKTAAALVLAVLMTGVIGANSAQAGDTMRHMPAKIGNAGQGGKVKVFRLTKLQKKSQKAPKTSGPDRLPRSN